MADPDVEVVATMLRFRDLLKDESEDVESAEILVEARDLILDLIDAVPQEQPLVPEEFRVTTAQVFALFAKMLGGEEGDDIAKQVVRAIAVASTGKSEDELTAVERAALEAGEDSAPLRPAKRSSRRRSGSAGATSGRRRGGGAGGGRRSVHTSRSRTSSSTW